MINGFEEITYHLTEYERDILLPIMIKGLKKRHGIENAITSKVIQEKCSDAGYKLNGARIRKLINYIRINHLVPFLMATSKGYYVENDISKLYTYIESLNQRANAILAVAKSLEKQLSNDYFLNELPKNKQLKIKVE